MTEAGRADPVLGVLGTGAPVFQWHGRAFDLPAGAEQLARTDSCEHQAFRWGASAYGFQFHLEAEAAMIERWLALPAYRDELAARGRDEHAIRTATNALIVNTQRLARDVFNNFLDLIGRPNRRIVLPSRGMPAH
jgi:GMP synthase (glutamine-hydrolysing)